MLPSLESTDRDTLWAMVSAPRVPAIVSTQGLPDPLNLLTVPAGSGSRMPTLPEKDNRVLPDNTVSDRPTCSENTHAAYFGFYR